MTVHVSLAEAKATLGALIDQAEAGESVHITRRGKPVARIVPMRSVRKPIDLAALRALTERMPPQKEDAGTFMRAMREAERY